MSHGHQDPDTPDPHHRWEDDGSRPLRPCGCVGLGICEHATQAERDAAARQAGRVDPKRRTD